MAKHELHFEHLGIATVLKHQRLLVPPNQRDYLWEDSHVKDLFQDIAEAINGDKPSYFLGTIVLTAGEDGVPQVTDGQQRLATISILLASFRDYYSEKKRDMLVGSIENDFLFEIDRSTERRVPKLTLNIDDKDYFNKRILSRPGHEDRSVQLQRTSHELIDSAAKRASKQVEAIVAQHNDKAAMAALEKWTKYLLNDATVIEIIVPDSVNAFKMFETLNDRGLKVSQAYLVKNFLFGEAGYSAVNEMHQKWGQMDGALEALADDDAVMNYLWNMAIMMNGHTRNPEIFDKIRDAVKGSPQAVEFVTMLADRSSDYIAIMQPDHVKWKTYPSSVRQLIETMNVLRVKVQRPCMFAISVKFSPNEAAKAFKLILSWSVRFLIVGGGRSGGVQEFYANIAHGIENREIKNAEDLARKAEGFIPSDTEFEGAFASANVSANHLARYYLRAIEQKTIENPNPEFVVNADATQVTLEHVMPQHPEGSWSQILTEVAEAHVNRLGNLALLGAASNVAAGNDSIRDKAKVYAKSGFKWTKMMAMAKSWGPSDINARQQKMAKEAVSIWSLKP